MRLKLFLLFGLKTDEHYSLKCWVEDTCFFKAARRRRRLVWVLM